MALASQALKFARTYLNDINGVTWSDSILMEYLKLAHAELVQELELNRTATMKIQSGRITVPAGATTLGINQPSNIINPISMIEGAVGADPDFFQDMIKITFIPTQDQISELVYWSWLGQVITFLGATTDRQIILRYDGSLTAPVLATDNLGCLWAENYIGPRIVALAFAALGKDNETIQGIAETNLYKLIQSQVTNDQRPTRRRAYRSSRSFYSGRW